MISVVLVSYSFSIRGPECIEHSVLRILLRQQNSKRELGIENVPSESLHVTKRCLTVGVIIN